MKNIRFDIIYLLIVIASIFIFGIVGFAFSPLLLIVYSQTTKEKSKFKKGLITLSILGALFGLLGSFLLINMKESGLDSLGTALFYGFLVQIGYFTTIGGSILLLIIDNRKSICKKNTIFTVLTLGLLVLLFLVIRFYLTTEKVPDNIPTVGDFETALIERKLKTNGTDYRLYGVNSKSNKAIGLTFKDNKDEKYPLYVFAIIDFDWIIYYTNGDLYAVKGKYWDYKVAHHQVSGYNEEKIIWEHQIDNEIISEKEEVTVYNRKFNRYEKSNKLSIDYFTYYSKDHDKDSSVFVDIPSKDSDGSTIEKVDRIDKNLLKSRVDTK